MSSGPDQTPVIPLLGVRDAAESITSSVERVDRLLGILLVAAATLAAGIAVAFFHRMNFLLLLRDWCLDDTFYYLQTAKVFSQSGKVSFDGINPTNGFHVLWFLLCVPIHWLGRSPEESTRLLKLLEVLTALGVFLAFAGLIRSVRGFWFLGIPVLLGLAKTQTFLFGLEGGVNALTVIVSGLMAVWLFSRREPPSAVELVLLSLVVALAPLARIENLAFGVFLLGLLSLYGLWKVKWFGKRQMLLLIAPFLLVMLLFLATSYLLFDTPFPISGLVKRWWASLDPQATTWYEDFLLLLRVPAVRSGFVFSGIGLVVLASSWSAPRYRDLGDERQQVLDVFFLSLAFFHGIKTLVYAIFSTPYWSQMPWYHVSGLLLTWLVILYTFIRVSWAASLIRYRSPQAASRAVVLSYVAVNAFAVALFFPSIMETREAVSEYRRWTTLRSPDWEIASYMGAQWMNDNLPNEAIVGSWDAGVLGYFADATVINLDGLINSYPFLQSMKEGRFEQFLADSRVEYLANVFPSELVDLRDFAAAEARQPHPLRGATSLVFADTRLTVPADRWTAGSFRVYRYQPPQASN